MANVTFKRNTKAIIDATPIVDGQVLFETDQGNNSKIRLDSGAERIEIGGKTDVIDNLDSTETTSALSANQGKVLNDKIETKIDKTRIVGEFPLAYQYNTKVASADAVSSLYTSTTRCVVGGSSVRFKIKVEKTTDTENYVSFNQIKDLLIMGENGVSKAIFNNIASNTTTIYSSPYKSATSNLNVTISVENLVGTDYIYITVSNGTAYSSSLTPLIVQYNYDSRIEEVNKRR